MNISIKYFNTRKGYLFKISDNKYYTHIFIVKDHYSKHAFE